MSNDVIASPDDDGLPEPLARFVENVNKAGQTGGELGGTVLGTPLALGTKLVASLAGKSEAESDALAEKVLNGSRAVGKTAGKVAPLAVLSAPVLIGWRLLRNKG